MNDFVVAGLGPSLRKLPRAWYDARRVIAVNNYPWRCEHLVVLDGPNEMTESKRDGILSTMATRVWLARLGWWQIGFDQGEQLASLSCAPNYAKHFEFAMQACRKEGVEGWLPKGPGSTTVAASMAFALGAERIAIVGVDCTEGHTMHGERQAVADWFYTFRRIAAQHGCTVQAVNSEALRFMQVEEGWLRECTHQA